MIKIASLRAMTGLSQKAFGERLGLKSGAIAKYERNDVIPPPVLKLIQYEFNEFLEEDGLEFKVRDPDFGPSSEEVQNYNDTIAELWLENKELLQFKNKYNWLLKEKETLVKHNEELQLKLQKNGIKY